MAIQLFMTLRIMTAVHVLAGRSVAVGVVKKRNWHSTGR